MENTTTITPAIPADAPALAPPAPEPTVENLKKALNLAYSERAELLGFIAKVLPTHLSWDDTGDAGFKSIICAHGPAGQMAWHISDADRKKLDEMNFPFEPSHFDGHSTEQKYQRLREITPDDFSTVVAKDPGTGTILRFFCPMRVVFLTIPQFDKLYPITGGDNQNGNSN